MSRTLIRNALGRALSGLWLAAVVTTGLPTLVSAFAQQPELGLPVAEDAPAPPTTQWEDRWEKDAAAVLADRLRARFRETLDFEPLIDEFFVADVGRRNASAGYFKEILGECNVAPELVAQLDEADLRRGYVACLNIGHLHTAYMLGTNDLGDESPEGDGDVPPAVAREFAASPYLRALLDEGGGETWAPRIETRDDYLRLVSDMESVCAAYRRLVTSQTFDSPTYAANRESFRADEAEVSDVVNDEDSGYSKFGVAAGARVFEVRRDGMLWYSAVDENGSYRIVTVSLGGD